jgi:hypothetical protein
MQKSKYYFCYSPTLHKFLHNKKKLPYICAALHENSKRKFWLYERNEQLDSALKEYESIFK